MIASELTLGCWVKATNNGACPLPAEVAKMLPRAGKVVGINGDTVWLDFVDFGFMLDSIEPVTLTPEILEKNFRGYRRGSGALTHFIYEQLNEEYFIRAGVGGIDLCMHYDDSEHAAHDDIYLVELRYVHTLQQALRICGIDRDIVL